MKQLWKNITLRRNLILAVITWSASMFNYYLNLFYIKYIPGNIYQNSLYVGLTDFTAHAISGYV
jgi:hypothetical protein